LEWLWTKILLISASWVPRITGMSHKHLASLYSSVSGNNLWISLLGLPQLNTTDWGAEQQTLIFSQFQGLEVQAEGVGRAGFFRGLSSWLVDNHLLSVCSHGLSSVPGCVLISSYKDTSHID
jgi:hypothetical protein